MFETSFGLMDVDDFWIYSTIKVKSEIVDDGNSEKWHNYPSVGRKGTAAAGLVMGFPTAASDVSVDEIRSAATSGGSGCSDHHHRYPLSLHAPLISSPEPPPYIAGDKLFDASQYAFFRTKCIGKGG